MHKIKAIIMSSLLLVFASVVVVPAPAAFAETPKEAVCRGVDNTTNCGGATGISLNNIVKNIILLLSTIVGVAAVIMIVVSGLKYTTSGGDSSSVASAKSTMVYAIIGLIVAAVAQFIVRYVLKSVGG